MKLYIDFPESIAGAKIDCEFRDYGLTLIVRVPNSKARRDSSLGSLTIFTKLYCSYVECKRSPPLYYTTIFEK